MEEEEEQQQEEEEKLGEDEEEEEEVQTEEGATEGRAGRGATHPGVYAASRTGKVPVRVGAQPQL